MNISLVNYGFIISDKETGDRIYNDVKKILDQDNECIVDFSQIKSMATFNAKQIFGKLYLELGSESFFKRVLLKNASEDLKLIIRLGIQSALEDKGITNM